MDVHHLGDVIRLEEVDAVDALLALNHTREVHQSGLRLKVPKFKTKNG